MDRRPSAQTISVLRALADDVQTWRYGYELGQEVGLKAGSLYPILMRLSDRGLLESAWEQETPAGRPPRHLYRLTGEGVRYAAAHVGPERPAVAEPVRRARSVAASPLVGGGWPIRAVAGGVR